MAAVLGDQRLESRLIIEGKRCWSLKTLLHTLWLGARTLSPKHGAPWSISEESDVTRSVIRDNLLAAEWRTQDGGICGAGNSSLEADLSENDAGLDQSSISREERKQLI